MTNASRNRAGRKVWWYLTTAGRAAASVQPSRTSGLRGLLLAIAVLTLACSLAIPRNEYGLPVITSERLYRASVTKDPAKRLVDLEQAIPGIRLDIRYATPNNFMKRPLYPEAKAFLRKPAAEALAAVQAELQSRGLALEVFDAYRPYSVTKMMWEPYKDPDFVADPSKGSRHNRGCAVDLTIVGSDGIALAMPTDYDAFTPKARHDAMDVPAAAIANRTLLREVMERHGFVPLQSEWWHYDFIGWERFELLDLPLSVFTGPIQRAPGGPVSAAWLDTTE